MSFFDQECKEVGYKKMFFYLKSSFIRTRHSKINRRLVTASLKLNDSSSHPGDSSYHLDSRMLILSIIGISLKFYHNISVNFTYHFVDSLHRPVGLSYNLIPPCRFLKILLIISTMLHIISTILHITSMRFYIRSGRFAQHFSITNNELWKRSNMAIKPKS